METHAGEPGLSSGGRLKLLIGFAAVFTAFQALAEALGSDRGEAGLLVAAGVIAGLLLVEWGLFGRPLAVAARELGFARPSGPGLAIALGLSAVLLLVIPVYAWMRGAAIVPYPGWPWLIAGLFAQAGIAEEALFRGYLFRRLRQGRSFWRAAMLATVPFVLVHLFMFATLPWPVALAGVLLAAIMGFPLAYLFEAGGNTVWAPALLHFTVQGAVKILEIPGDAGFPILWMGASAVIPWLAFPLRQQPQRVANGD